MPNAQSTRTPQQVPLPEPATKLLGSYYHNLAIGVSGTLYAWGCGTFCDGKNDGIIPALGVPTTASGPSRDGVQDRGALPVR